MRSLHANAAKRGVRHEMLSANACAMYGVRSLSELSIAQLREYRDQICDAPVRGNKQPKPTRPSGKRRSEDTVWLPSPRQRRFITSLLEQLFGKHPEPIATADKCVQRWIGPAFDTSKQHDSFAAIADAVMTGKAAGMLIKRLVGEMKKRGLWREPAAQRPTRS